MGDQNQTVDFEDFRTIKPVPLVDEPKKEDYETLAENSIKSRNLKGDEADLVREQFKDLYENELKKFQKMGHITVHVRRLTTDQFDSLIDENDRLLTEELLRIKSLRENFAEVKEHPCHEENFQTKQFEKETYQWRMGLFEQTIEKLEPVTLKGETVDWSSQENRARFFESIVRTGLGTRLQLIAQNTQAMKWEDLFA